MQTPQTSQSGGTKTLSPVAKVIITSCSLQNLHHLSSAASATEVTPWPKQAMLLGFAAKQQEARRRTRDETDDQQTAGWVWVVIRLGTSRRCSAARCVDSCLRCCRSHHARQSLGEDDTLAIRSICQHTFVCVQEYS